MEETNPILKFANRQNNNVGFTPTTDNPILKFANKQSGIDFATPTSADKVALGSDAYKMPATVDDARKLQQEDPSLWSRIAKNLMKPVGVVATLSEETGRAIGHVASGNNPWETIKNTPAKIGGILSGTRERSFVDVFKENWKPLELDTKGGTDVTANFINDVVPSLLGTITDIAADPLNFISGGLTKTGKAADKFQQLKKAGEVIKENSKFAKELQAMGITRDMLELGATKAEQVQKGQRALLTVFANTPWEKTLVGGAPIYETTAKIGQAFKATKTAEILKRVFSTKTSNDAFNTVTEHFSNLREYRKGAVMDEALDIQKNIANLSKDEAYKIIDVIEGKIPSSGVKEIDDIAKRLKTNFDEIGKAESKLGLLKTEIADYFPHIKIKEKPATIAGIFDRAKYSTALGSSKERTISGSVSEINQAFGTEFFEQRPAVAFAQRALASAKAVSNKEYLESIKVFGKNAQHIDDPLKFVFGPTGADSLFDVQRAIDAGDIARDAVFKEGNILKATYAKGRIDDIAMKLNELETGLGETFRKSIKLGKVSMEDIVTRAKQVIEEAGPNISAGYKNWVEVPGLKELKGLKFAPDVARSLTDYSKAIKPDELNVAIRTFDQVQNWWKAQALVAPSYHVRNLAGNMWNNFLGGVKGLRPYVEAGQIQSGKPVQFTDDIGRLWDNARIMEAAKKSGVINEGWYAKDIDVALSSEFEGNSWNPLKQNFGLYKANRQAGTVFENNSRLAHFIQRLKEGSTIDDAALSVKKYLFDYADLTTTEKEIFKRALPFYTWTRKNIPLQIEKLITEPAKFAILPKVQKGIESNVEKPDEKYLGDYIKDNVGVRVGTDEKGNTFYFLMGSWLPSAQAIDFLSQPTENMVISLTPFIKTPIELWSNQSFFFEDSFGQPSKIERYPQENQSWLGFTMRKKTANVLKNIRILNELDKLNPGSIFGTSDSPSLVNRIAPEAGVKLPLGVGTITTSEKRGGRFTPETTQTARVLQSLFGKSVPYNPNYAKQFYLWDTDTKIRELEKAAKDAAKDGQKEYSKRLREEIIKVKKSR